MDIGSNSVMVAGKRDKEHENSSGWVILQDHLLDGALVHNKPGMVATQGLAAIGVDFNGKGGMPLRPLHTAYIASTTCEYVGGAFLMFR